MSYPSEMPRALPLDGEHAVPLQIAERAVVGHQFEAVVGALEGAPGTVAAVAPIADVRRQQGHPLVVAEQTDPPRRLALGTVQMAEASRRQDFLLPVGVEVEQASPRARRSSVGSADSSPASADSGQRRSTTRAVASRVDAR